MKLKIQRWLLLCFVLWTIYLGLLVVGFGNLAEQVLPDHLRKHIVSQEAASQANFACFSYWTAATIYGPLARQWRPPAVSPIAHLYLAGAGVFFGSVIEAVFISGTLAADEIYGRSAT